jgi:SHS2 domain-containing protein
VAAAAVVMAMGRYRTLESIAIADVAIEVDAATLDELFETAAVALAELEVDPATVSVTAAVTVALAAPSIELLLFDWLGELIFRRDRDGLVFTRAVVSIRRHAGWHLVAHLGGGLIDSTRTVLRADVKAVTLHDFRLERVADGWRARVVFDT